MKPDGETSGRPGGNAAKRECRGRSLLPAVPTACFNSQHHQHYPSGDVRILLRYVTMCVCIVYSLVMLCCVAISAQDLARSTAISLLKVSAFAAAKVAYPHLLRTKNCGLLQLER